MPGWIEAFIVIAALAIVLQMAILLALYLQFRAASQQITRVAANVQRKLEPILNQVNDILEVSQDRITSVVSDAAEITRVARSQAQKIDRVFSEAVERLRLQVIRADQIISGTLEVVEGAGHRVRQSFWGPVLQISAVLKGIKTGLEFIRGQQRRPPEAASVAQDEELFI